MVLSMCRPFQHPKTGIYWFRKRLPADIALLLGKEEERYSLIARDANEAKRRHAEEILKLEVRWDGLRSRPGDSIAPPTAARMTEAQAHQRAAWM